MKRILFLDDDHDRIHMFKVAVHLVSGIDAVIVETADEAITALRAQEFDILMLDHDLGGRTFVDIQDVNTGTRVAKTIAEEGLQPNAEVIVHSFNYPAAMGMIAIMKRGRYFPSAWLEDNLRQILGSTTE